MSEQYNLKNPFFKRTFIFQLSNWNRFFEGIKTEDEKERKRNGFHQHFFKNAINGVVICSVIFFHPAKFMGLLYLDEVDMEWRDKHIKKERTITHFTNNVMQNEFVLFHFVIYILLYGCSMHNKKSREQR